MFSLGVFYAFAYNGQLKAAFVCGETCELAEGNLNFSRPSMDYKQK